MTTLLPEERTALVNALENDGYVYCPSPSLETIEKWTNLIRVGVLKVDRTEGIYLTPAGHIVATLLRDAPSPSDLTRAQGLLREWMEAAGSGHYDYLLSLQPNDIWRCKLRYFTGAMLNVTDSVSRACDPLAAVRAAIEMTPWSVVVEIEKEDEEP